MIKTKPTRGRISVQDLICSDEGNSKTYKTKSTVSSSFTTGGMGEFERGYGLRNHRYGFQSESPAVKVSETVGSASFLKLQHENCWEASNNICSENRTRYENVFDIERVSCESHHNFQSRRRIPEVSNQFNSNESRHDRSVQDMQYENSISISRMINNTSSKWERNVDNYRHTNLPSISGIHKKDRGGVKLKKLWTPHEDELLRQLANMGPENWNKISASLPGRTGKQCRERWLNHLQDGIRKGFWTPAEDQIIIEEQAKRGNRWSVIARMLPGRSDNAVKNRFNATLKKQFGRRDYE